MDDAEIVRRISELVADEHELESVGSTGAPSHVDVARLREIEVALDQCWDLLRQRRARRNAGQDPDEATVRPENIVEGYTQ
jgi:uncharacterized protein DUF2630